MKPKDVSVIIPAYNAEAVIERALKSVFTQTTLPAEILVIDDGSQDKTQAVVQKLADKAPVPVRLISQKNAGAAAARNAGIQKAKGKVIAFLDADDAWRPAKVERSLEEIEKRQLGFVAHNFIQRPEGTRGEKDVTINGAKNYKRYQHNPLVGLYLRPFVQTSSVVVQKKVLEQAGLFNPHFHSAHDHDLFLRCFHALRPREIYVFDEPLSIYTLSPGGITTKVWRRFRLSVQVAVANRALLPGPLWRQWQVCAQRLVFVGYELLSNVWVHKIKKALK